MSELREFGRIISGNRQPFKDFSPELRGFILGAKAAGASQTAIADAVGTRRQRVGEQIKRFKDHNTVHSRPRPRKSRAIGPREERYVVQFVRRQPRSTYQDLRVSTGLNVHDRTFQRVLRRHHLRKWRAAHKIRLDEQKARTRLRFARKYRDPAKLRQLLEAFFSDECIVQTNPDKPSDWVVRFGHERFRKDLVNEESHVKAAISIMVWGMIWQRAGEGHQSPLIVMEGDPKAPRGGVSSRVYLQTLEDGLLPYYEPGDIFMQDGAQIHTANKVKVWFETHGIEVIDWPPYSPDLNPIEHCWHRLKREIYRLNPNFGALQKNEADIATAKEIIQRAWRRISGDLIHRLLDSLKHRLAAVRRARGWYTKF
ncbi:hypothetical protein FHL15_000728 [Xylaria flabelliformis]|uniref:Tc1-like transposase DDE domain-containing protein n=1 Tax=Xylaria flabelliformis TaxID=2512241 RepID=A0A553IEP0_9PEZI|nr:hypothetical protein FHL15_000728 [Xylaria flabelliformis]